ncbi:hypothetical protein ABW19_dt0205652 [Dactylella cylindrospora]|nr:hypothetical protein ABW19_dt0205652 [Dactylella cylindrospora]
MMEGTMPGPSKPPLQTLPGEILLSILRELELLVSSTLDLPASKLPPKPPPKNATHLTPATTRCPTDPLYKYFCYDGTWSDWNGHEKEEGYKSYHIAIKEALDGFSRASKWCRNLVTPIFFKEVSIIPRDGASLDRLKYIASSESFAPILSCTRTLHIILSGLNVYITISRSGEFVEPDDYDSTHILAIAEVLKKMTGLEYLTFKMEKGELGNKLNETMGKLEVEIPVKRLEVCPSSEWLIDFCKGVRQVIFELEPFPRLEYHRQGYPTCTIKELQPDAFRSRHFEFNRSYAIPIIPPYTQGERFLMRLRDRGETLRTLLIISGWVSYEAVEDIVKYIPNIKHLQMSCSWVGKDPGRLETHEKIFTYTATLKSLEFLKFTTIRHLGSSFAGYDNEMVAATWAKAPALKTLEIGDWFWEIERNGDGSMDILRTVRGAIRDGVRILEQDMGVDSETSKSEA